MGLLSNKQALGLQPLAESVRNVALGLYDPEALTGLTIAQYDNTAQSNRFSLAQLGTQRAES